MQENPVQFLGWEVPLEKESVTHSSILALGGSDSKESTCNVGDLSPIPELGRSARGGHDNPLQYPCLKNPHGEWSLVGYSPWGHKVSDMTDDTHT